MCVPSSPHAREVVPTQGELEGARMLSALCLVHARPQNREHTCERAGPGGVSTLEPRLVGACVPALEAPTFAPRPSRGAKLAGPCPAQLGLPGSSCCDSEQE